MSFECPLVSVIVPVYNTEPYLKQCLDSIMAQKDVDFEVVLVNDGSKDNSLAICYSYAEKYQNIRVFTQENGGVSKARNKGITEARGEWIYFFDSDDEMCSDCLKELVNPITPNVEYVMGAYAIVDRGKETYYTSFAESVSLTTEQVLDCMFHGVYQGYIPTKIFKRSIVQREGLRFDESIKFNEDRLFSVTYLTKVTGECCYTEHCLFRYMLRSTAAMASIKKGFNRNFITDFYAFERMLSLLKEFGYKNLFRVKYQMYCSYKTICEMARGEADSEVISTSLFDSLKMDLSCRELATIRLYDLYIKMRSLAGRIVRMVFTHN